MNLWKTGLVALLISSCASTPQATSPTAVVPQGPQLSEKQILTLIPTMVKSYYGDGILAGSVKTTYDETGLLKKEESFNPSGVLTEYKTGVFDGKKLKITSFNNAGEIQSSKVLTLGERNRITLEEFYSAKNVLQSVNSYEFDELDRVTRWIAKDGANIVLASTDYVYTDEKLQKIEIKDESGKLLKTYPHTYDPNGQLLEKKEVETDDSVTGLTSYTYDSNGLLLKEESKNSEMVILRITEYLYNGSQVPLKTNYLDRRGKIIEFKETEYTAFKKTVMERG